MQTTFSDNTPPRRMPFEQHILPFLVRLTREPIIKKPGSDANRMVFIFQDYTRHQGKLILDRKKEGGGYEIKEVSGRFEKHADRIRNFVENYAN